MNRHLFILLLLTAINYISNAQSFKKSDVLVTAGYGMIDWNSGVAGGNATGPLYLKAEYAISKHFGLGINFSYVHAFGEHIQVSWELDSNGNRTKYDSVRFAPEILYRDYSTLLRFNYHFGDSEKFDPYFGIGIGRRVVYWRHDQMQWADAGTRIRSGFSFSFGLRYYVIPNLGIYGELGLEKALLQGGITYKFINKKE